MKVIRIDNDVWKILKGQAIPLEDNPNSVLRRLLGIDEKQKKGTRKREKRLSRGSGRTDQKDFMQPILEVLGECNGRGEVKDIFKKLENKMKNHLKPVDFGKLKSGQIRWKNTAQWAKNELTSEGFLERNSPRGIWQTSQKGREHLKTKAVLADNHYYEK